MLKTDVAETKTDMASLKPSSCVADWSRTTEFDARPPRGRCLTC